MLYVIETPGHCPSCLTYYTDNYIFTGDSYIPNVKVVTKLPYGDKKKQRLLLNIFLVWLKTELFMQDMMWISGKVFCRLLS